MNDNALSTDHAANDNARPVLRLVLVCAACGSCEATVDGYCDGCIADANAAIDERRGWSDWRGDR